MGASVALYAGLGAALAGAALAGVAAPPRARAGRRRAPNARGVALALGGLLLAGAAAALPAPEHRVARPRSQLDALVPRYQFVERHAVHVRAPPALAVHAVRTVPADEIAGFRLLTWIRRLGRAGPPGLLDPPPGVPIVDVAAASGFRPLADAASPAAPGEPPAFELVYGAPGPATPAARARLTALPRTPDAFRALDAPGFAKTALNFRVVPDGRGGAVVSTETRVFATDAATRRRMAAYWRVIYPGSALIRRSWLAAIRRRAERDAAR